MALTSIGDVLLNGNPYLINRNTYRVTESTKSYPRTFTGNQPKEQHGDNWTYWNQSDFIGDSQGDWVSDGPFSGGYGLDLTTPGQFKVAKQLAQTQADAANPAGYVAFAAGTARIWFLGKTNGTGYHSTDGATWTTLANALAAGVTPTSVADYKGVYYVGASDGKLYSNSGGATFTAIAGALGTSSYVLGSYKGKLYVGYNNAVYTYDGTSFTAMFGSAGVGGASLVDGLPIIGAQGSSVLYFITQGPQSRVYMTDSNQLHQITTLGSDFYPYACGYIDTLYIFGAGTDDATVVGQVMRLSKSGLVTIYTFGDDTADYGIRSVLNYKGRLYWGANQKTGLGVYDAALDIFQDVQCGFYISSVITAIAGVVSGIAQFGKIMFCGITSNGIYKQTTPGTFSFTSSLFDGNTKNINKTWGFAEIKHTALTAGQSITLNTLKDGSTVDLWGSNSTVSATSTLITKTSAYKSPYLQYQITGNANGAALAVLDVSLAYIEVADDPKREWDLAFLLEGGAGSQFQIMRDGSPNTRSASTMLTELNNLWNTVTTFDDIDGTQYNVVMKVPRADMVDMIKNIQGGAISDMVLVYHVHLTQL